MKAIKIRRVYFISFEAKYSNNMLRNAMMIEAKVAKKDVDVGV